VNVDVWVHKLKLNNDKNNKWIRKTGKADK